MDETKFRKKLLLIAVSFLLLNMIIATQYAVTKIGYEYNIVHPCNSNIRYIGSDNSSDGKRILRVIDSNITNVGLKLHLIGNITTNQKVIYSAAFGIVNEEEFTLNITHINISSAYPTYMKIWLHGDRDANANSTKNDNTSVLMWDNNTMINASNTTAWTLAAGNNNPGDMCYNISNRTNCTIYTPWDNTSHVRYSRNDSNTVEYLSDFVWVQIEINIPNVVDHLGYYSGTIWIHFEADTVT